MKSRTFRRKRSDEGNRIWQITCLNFLSQMLVLQYSCDQNKRSCIILICYTLGVWNWKFYFKNSSNLFLLSKIFWDFYRFIAQIHMFWKSVLETSVWNFVSSTSFRQIWEFDTPTSVFSLKKMNDLVVEINFNYLSYLNSWDTNFVTKTHFQNFGVESVTRFQNVKNFQLFITLTIFNAQESVSASLSDKSWANISDFTFKALK